MSHIPEIVSDRPITVKYVKSPIEKIIGKLKEMPQQQGAGSEIIEVIALVQKFAQELEHEKAHAIIQIIKNCHTMDRIEFYRGHLDMIRKLQRDFESE